jgi:hypothetical protein
MTLVLDTGVALLYYARLIDRLPVEMVNWSPLLTVLSVVRCP